MYKIINRHVYEIASGENITLCDIVADSANDLPDVGDIALYKIAFGSFAYVIDEGVFYSLDSSGTWNGGAYSDVVTEVITARGSFSSLDARLDDMDVILNSAKLGVKYKGAVNYYNDLPSSGNEIGDAYTVKYAGSSGTTPDGTEYVWGELGGVAQWIDFSKDCYTKSEINTLLSGKVDVEAGKGLSSNDFTDADKSKLGGIAAGAEVNVQSDWNQSDNTADDYIKNKPTLGTAAAAASTDFATAAQGTKADRAIQSAGSGLSKSGTTLNHSNSVTAKTTRAIRKLSFDVQGHINGSDELSTSESNAISSGIDSTKVTQIETNKNNISKDESALVDLINDGAKNKLPIPAISDIVGTLSGNATINADGTITIILASDLTTESGINYNVTLPAGTFHYSSGENSSTEGVYDSYIQTYASGSWVTVLRDNTTNPGQTATIEAGSYRVTIRFRSGALAGTYVFKPMLCYPSYWNITEEYVTYRP